MAGLWGRAVQRWAALSTRRLGGYLGAPSRYLTTSDTFTGNDTNTLDTYTGINTSTTDINTENPWDWARPQSPPHQDITSPASALPPLLAALRSNRPLALARILLSLSAHPARPASSLLLTLLPTTFSALLATLDPLANASSLDPAWGIHIPAGLEQYSRVAALNDIYGVRHVHLALFPILLAAFHARLRHGHPVTPHDYAVLLRCAGACQSVHGTRTVWRLMDTAGHIEWRTTSLFADFAQARFLTVPLYYQFDRARVRLRPGDLYRSTTALPGKVRRRLDNLRASINVHRWQSHGIMADEPDETRDLAVSRFLRSQGPVERVSSYATRHGASMDEALFCATLIAWARTGARRKMKALLFRHYGIRVLENWDVGGFHISMAKAYRFREDSPRRPSIALIHAVVDAFGTTGDVGIGVKLAIDISSTWNIPITHAMWSAMLRWAYISCVKPFVTEWKIVRAAKPAWRSGPVEAAHVRDIWDAMSSALKTTNTAPTWSDVNIYVRILISSNDLALALDAMLDARERYDDLVVQTMRAYHALHSHNVGQDIIETLHFTWQRLRLRLDIARNDMRLWVRMWLRKHSQQRIARESPHETHRLIPRMASAFREWLPYPFKYRTSTGHIAIFIQGDPTHSLDRAGADAVVRTREQAEYLRPRHAKRAAQADAFADSLEQRMRRHRAARPAGRTVEPGRDVPRSRTVFVQPPPTFLHRLVGMVGPGDRVKGGIQGERDEGRYAEGKEERRWQREHVVSQPWVRRRVRVPWGVEKRLDVDGGERRKGGRVWLEPQEEDVY